MKGRKPSGESRLTVGAESAPPERSTDDDRATEVGEGSGRYRAAARPRRMAVSGARVEHVQQQRRLVLRPRRKGSPHARAEPPARRRRAYGDGGPALGPQPRQAKVAITPAECSVASAASSGTWTTQYVCVKGSFS